MWRDDLMPEWNDARTIAESGCNLEGPCWETHWGTSEFARMTKQLVCSTSAEAIMTNTIFYEELWFQKLVTAFRLSLARIP